MNDFKNLNIPVDAALLKEFKAVAAQRGMSLKGAGADALTQWVFRERVVASGALVDLSRPAVNESVKVAPIDPLPTDVLRPAPRRRVLYPDGLVLDPDTEAHFPLYEEDGHWTDKDGKELGMGVVREVKKWLAAGKAELKEE